MQRTGSSRGSTSLRARSELAAAKLAYEEPDHVGSLSRKVMSSSGNSSSPIALEAFTDGEEESPYIQYMDDGDKHSSELNFETISYVDADEAERDNLHEYLRKESSCLKSCWPKVVLILSIFFLLMVVGELLVIFEFPPSDNDHRNITTCNNSLPACFIVRGLRSIGIFGFFTGLLNCAFIELFFRRVYCIIGSGVVERQHQQILDGFRSIIMDILFDTSELKKFFSANHPRVREMLQLDVQFGGLLNSNAADHIIEEKINDVLTGPQGMVLLNMGVEVEELRSTARYHIKTILTNLSREIYSKLAVPGISDGEGLKAEISKILEPRMSQMSPIEVRQIMAAMLRRHFLWLIIYGMVFGVLLGILNELLIVTFRFTVGVIEF